MVFSITLIAVAVLLLAAAVGFILAKSGAVSEHATSDLSKLLVLVAQPALAIYTFKSTTYSPEKLLNVAIFAALVIGIDIIMFTSAYFIFRKKYDNPIYRIMTIATAMANCAFFGIPILEAIFPETSSDIILYTTVFSVVMNIFGWTVGSAIIARDTRYISLKKIFINPAVLGLAAALVLFIFEIPIENQPSLFSMITISAKMATPLSMLVMGMRLATMRWRDMLLDSRVYITIGIKQIIMPLVAFLAVWLLPVDPMLGKAFFVICACPVASVVLNYAEMVGEGQKEAASMVLVGTMLSIVTLPVMTLLLGLL